MNGLFGFWHRITPQRRKRLLLYVLAVIVVLATLWAARSVLGLYFIGVVLAYILAPVVDAIQKGIRWIAYKTHLGFLRKAARSLGIVISYLLLISMIAGFISLVIPIVMREAQQLWDAREVIWSQISRWGEDVLAQYELLPDRIKQQIDDTLRNLSAFVTNVVQQAVQGTFVAISYTFSVVLGITIVPFWTYFLLRDIGQIRRSIYNALPKGVRHDVRSMLLVLDRTVGAYLRGELLLMLIIGVMQTIALTLLGLDYALLLGVIAGLLEIIPNIGPTLAAVPAILVALTRSPLLALVTALVANLVQNIENSLIVPRVLGGSMGLHPVVMMVMLVIGTEIAGLPGLILAPILTAVLRDVYRYLNLRFADDPLTPEQALEKVTVGSHFAVDL